MKIKSSTFVLTIVAMLAVGCVGTQKVRCSTAERDRSFPCKEEKRQEGGVQKTGQRAAGEGFRIIHNNDGTDLLGNLWHGSRSLTLEDLNECVDLVASCNVTTYMICAGSDLFYYRSKYGRVIGDDLGGTLDNWGDSATIKSAQLYYGNFLKVEETGDDFVSHCLKRAAEDGMETFITFRMNDLHFADTTANSPLWRPDFWAQHPQWWLGDATQGYHSENALDFAVDEVRAHRLAVVKEQLEKYGSLIDGFELDFMRFYVYFKTGEGKRNAPLLTDFVREVRRMTDSLSAAQGRPVLLAARVGPSAEMNLFKGLDVKEWLREGLLDFVSIGVHWRGDPAMSVAQFRKDMGKDLNVPLYSSVDDGGYRPREFWSHGQFRGMCAHALSQGADGLYFFNFYFGEYLSAGRSVNLSESGLACRIRTPELLRELGSLDSLRGKNKIYALSDGVVQYNIEPNSPLPLTLQSNRTSKAEIWIGDDPSKEHPAEEILFIRTGRPVDLDISINGNALTVVKTGSGRTCNDRENNSYGDLKISGEGKTLCSTHKKQSTEGGSLSNGRRNACEGRKIAEEKPEYVSQFDKALGLEGEDEQRAFLLPAGILKKGYNQLEFRLREPSDPGAGREETPAPTCIKRIELALRYGESEKCGYF